MLRSGERSARSALPDRLRSWKMIGFELVWW